MTCSVTVWREESQLGTVEKPQDCWGSTVSAGHSSHSPYIRRLYSQHSTLNTQQLTLTSTPNSKNNTQHPAANTLDLTPNTEDSTFNTHTQHLTPNTQHLTLNTKQSTPNEVTICLILVWSDVLIHSVVKSHWRQSYCKQRRSQTTTTISLYSGDNECPNITNSSGHMASNKDKEIDDVVFFS